MIHNTDGGVQYNIFPLRNHRSQERDKVHEDWTSHMRAPSYFTDRFTKNKPTLMSGFPVCISITLLVPVLHKLFTDRDINRPRH
ncbi:hypothetical protein BDR04DRAFT_1104348 [Suillus decipiens]|nr:hypothetical protein BDR04DRAFT_1104348 [Suillus decipiens]